MNSSDNNLISLNFTNSLPKNEIDSIKVYGVFQNI